VIREEEGGRRKAGGGRRKEEGGRRRKEEGGGRVVIREEEGRRRKAEEEGGGGRESAPTFTISSRGTLWYLHTQNRFPTVHHRCSPKSRGPILRRVQPESRREETGEEREEREEEEEGTATHLHNILQRDSLGRPSLSPYSKSIPNCPSSLFPQIQRDPSSGECSQRVEERKQEKREGGERGRATHLHNILQRDSLGRPSLISILKIDSQLSIIVVPPNPEGSILREGGGKIGTTVDGFYP
jgi:ATP-dependent RNA helicase DHX57